MSGIYGIFRFDGAPVEPDTLTSMREAMAYFGPDGGGQWCEGPAGLGQLLLRITPEDYFENQPIRSEDTTLVAAARIDNRDELFREFGIPAFEHPTTPDSMLILKAYRKWGDDSPLHLDGDWQFAAYNHKTRSMFIARDHHGNSSLYYHQNAHFMAFASTQKALLTLPEVPNKPDMMRMAQILTAWHGDGTRSSREAIFHLAPAHVMSVNVNGTTKLRRYWFPENLPEIRRTNGNEYVEEFLQHYNKAVHVRLRSVKPIGVTLSGGLDSGSVTALAAPMLADLKQKLTAFTAIPMFSPSGAGKGRFGDEWELAAATARMSGSNIEHIPVRSEGVSVLEGIVRHLRLVDSPSHGASNMYWLHDIMEQSRDRGIGVLLTGQQGNGSISFAGNGQFIQSFLRGDFGTATQTLLQADKTVLTGIKRQVLKPLLTPALRYYRENKGAGKQPWQDYSAINPDFAKKIGLLKLMKRAGHDPTFTASTVRCRQRSVLKLGESIGGSMWHEMGAGYALDVRDPTSDRRLIEFCLQIPDHQYYWKGKTKKILQQGFADKIPREVLQNPKTGLQGADNAHRVRLERSQLMSIMNDLEAHQATSTLLDLQYMKMLLNSLGGKNDDVSINFKCGTVLLRGLMVGMFVASYQSDDVAIC